MTGPSQWLSLHEFVTTSGVAITAGLVVIAILTLVEWISPRSPFRLSNAFPGVLFTLSATPIAILVAVLLVVLGVVLLLR